MENLLQWLFTQLQLAYFRVIMSFWNMAVKLTVSELQTVQ